MELTLLERIEDKLDLQEQLEECIIPLVKQQIKAKKQELDTLQKTWQDSCDHIYYRKEIWVKDEASGRERCKRVYYKCLLCSKKERRVEHYAGVTMHGTHLPKATKPEIPSERVAEYQEQKEKEETLKDEIDELISSKQYAEQELKEIKDELSAIRDALNR